MEETIKPAAAPAPAGRRDDRLTFYRGNEACVAPVGFARTDVMTPPELAPELLEQQLDLTPLMAGTDMRLLFRQETEDGFSLIRVWFGPRYTVARHSHSADCLYFVLKGEVRAGNRVVKAGDGFFVPANQPYGYVAGPDGVELLEFRKSTKFNSVVHDRDPKSWARMLAVAADNQKLWRALKPRSLRASDGPR